MVAPLQIGRYVLHGEIASGGMASVHYGRLVGTGGFSKTVAIKRLHRALAQTPSFRNMILEEGRLAARVRHPNVVPPLDVLAEGGELLLVMEYVHGESLSRLLRAAWGGGERVPLTIGAAIMSNVLHGLHAAHDAKDETGKPLDIVHRDVSPQNILVGADGVARVIDFGIAKAVTSEEMTTAGTIKGKVPYLSPEQLEGDPATRRTDIYATAVVFWEVLAGRRLFQGEDDADVLRQIMSKKIDPPSAFNPLVAAKVDDVVLRGLARDPKERYPTAREMALALEDAVHLATASVVGAWTERLAAATLAERAEQIRDVEGSASRRGVETAPPPPPPAPPASAAPIAAAPVSDETIGATPGTVRMPATASGVPGAVGARSRLAPARRTVPPGAPPVAPSPSQPRASRPPPPLPAAASRAPSMPPPPAALPVIPAPPAKGAPRLSIPSAPGSNRAPMSGAPDSVRASTPPVRPPVSARPAIEPRTVIYEPPPLPEPDFIEGVRAISPGAVPPGPLSGPRSSPQSSPLSPPPAGALRKPELAIRNVDWLTPRDHTPPPPSLFKRFLSYLAVFLVLALIVAWMFAPAIARAWIVTGAAARGIVVTIDRVDVTRKAIRLSDVHAESAELPGATLRAGTLTIGLRWLVPDTVSLDDAEVAFDGSYSTIATRFAAYRAKHGAQLVEPAAGLHQVEVTSGHIVWKDVIGAGTSALVENVTFDMTKNAIRPLGDDYHMNAPLFTMRLAGAAAGPWQIDVDRQGILVRSVLNLDPSGSYPASITHTAGDDGSVSINLAVPPTTLAELHLPPAVLGGAGSDRTRFEAHGEVSVVAVQQATTRAGDAGASVAKSDGGAGDAGAMTSPAAALTSRSVSGHIILAAGGISVFPSGPLVDLSLDLPIAGDAAGPIPIAGVLTVAAADPAGGGSKAAAAAPLKGTLDVGGAAVRVDLAGQTGPIACAKATPAPGGGGGGLAPGVAATSKDANGIVATIAMALDDLPGARVSLQPQSQCTPKLR